MAIGKTYTLGNKTLINAGNNGDVMLLGDPDEEEMGAWSLHFVDAAETGGQPFSGSITIVVRSRVPEASQDNIQWRPTPYRRVFLNGAAVPDFNPAVAPITTTSLVLVPSSGFCTALMVTCAGGSMTLYRTHATGESAVG